MKSSKVSLLIALFGLQVCSPASAMWIDLGNTAVEFDSSAFSNFDGGGFLVGSNAITFNPGASVSVPDSGGSGYLNVVASFHFAAKPGYSITGFTLTGSGTGSAGAYSSAGFNGTFTADGLGGNWSQTNNIGASTTVAVEGLLWAQSNPYYWSTWEEVGRGWVVIGQEDYVWTESVWVRDDPVLGRRSVWGWIGRTESGENVYGWVTESYVVEWVPVYENIEHHEWRDVWGDGPIYGDVLHMVGTPASMSFDSMRIDVLAVPEPAEWVLMSVGIGFMGWLVRRRQSVRADA